MKAIDLNSDLGELEGNTDDRSILRLITSANISCGVHAGSVELTKRTIAATQEFGVAIGAHPGLAGSFGRFDSPIDTVAALRQITDQLFQFKELADAAGAVVSHIKPHGALYNQAETDEAIARCIVQAVHCIWPNMAIYGLAGGLLLQVSAEQGYIPVREFFADRIYDSFGKLVSRSVAGSVISDPHFIAERTLRAVKFGTLTAKTGEEIIVAPQTVCVHGDSSSALAVVTTVRETLLAAGVRIERP